MQTTRKLYNDSNTTRAKQKQCHARIIAKLEENYENRTNTTIMLRK